MLNAVIIWLITFLGLPIGILIASQTKEELKSGKKYFNIILKACLFILIIILLSRTINFLALFLFLLGLIMAFFIRHLYLYFGLAFIAITGVEGLLIIASLIFICGLVRGTFLVYKKQKLLKNIVLDLILFVVPLLILFIPQINTDLVSYFVAGALFIALICKSN